MDGNLFDVLIVGGGSSGLAAFHRLKKQNKNLKIKLLEAKDRLGGRILGRTLETNKGSEKFDLGGQWVGRTQLHVIRLLKEFGLDLYEQSYNGKTVNIMNENEMFFTTSPLDLVFSSFWFAHDIAQGMKKIDEFSQQISLDNPLSSSRAKEWDSMPMNIAKVWLFKHEWSRKIIDVAFITMFGFDINQASFLYFLLYAKSAGGITALIDDRFPGNAQEYKVKGGMFNLIERLSEAVGIENIDLNAPVISIDQKGYCCCLTTKSGSKFESKHVVLSIPTHLICDMTLRPPLSEPQTKLLKCVKVGCLMKCIVTYSDKFWESNGQSGVSLHWPHYREEESITHPVSLTYDATSSVGSPALVGFIGGSVLLKMQSMSDYEIKEAIVNSFVLLFGKQAKTPVDVKFQDWSQVEYNGGCPVTYTMPGAVSFHGDVRLKEPHGRIHIAGTETATLWRGFISGAIQSGERAADEILREMDDTYAATDIVKWEHILMPGLLTEQRNSFYALNGILATSLTAVIAILSFVVLKIHKKWYNH